MCHWLFQSIIFNRFDYFSDLSRAQRTLSKSLDEFNFECIGTTRTDDEQVIVNSLKQFSRLIASIEDERDNMVQLKNKTLRKKNFEFFFSVTFLQQLANTHDQIVVALENFRKERIGGVKENKKKFDKKTAKFCQAQERFLNMSSKKPDNTVLEVSNCLNLFVFFLIISLSPLTQSLFLI